MPKSFQTSHYTLGNYSSERPVTQSFTSNSSTAIMGKRAAEDVEGLQTVLKKGERPLKSDDVNEAGEFEDEFEDEFESEEELFEAGVDGRPDAEREVEESRGMWLTPVALCGVHYTLRQRNVTDVLQTRWMSTSRPSYQDEISFKLESPWPQIHLLTRCSIP